MGGHEKVSAEGIAHLRENLISGILDSLHGQESILGTQIATDEIAPGIKAGILRGKRPRARIADQIIRHCDAMYQASNQADWFGVGVAGLGMFDLFSPHIRYAFIRP